MSESDFEKEVELDRVSKRFEDESGRPARGPGGKELPAALAGISIAVRKGELLVVVGPSGCGKSTTLRIVAGLEDADGGDVRIGGKSMKGVPPQDRDVEIGRDTSELQSRRELVCRLLLEKKNGQY